MDFQLYPPIYQKTYHNKFWPLPSINIAEARKLRLNARELLAKNIDPKAERDSHNEFEKDSLENTLGVWVEHWREKKAKEVKETTITKAYNSLKNYILPYIKDLPIRDVRVKHITPLMQPLILEDKRETAKRISMFLNEVMRLAVASGVIEFNPLADLTKTLPAPAKQSQLTISPDELPELMSRISAASISKNTYWMFLLQLHTMVRPIEAATMQWIYIDFDKRLITLPPERMKMRKPHIIPMSEQVFALLKHIQLVNGHRPYLFPSNKDPLSHANSQTVNMMLKRNGFKGRLVAHGLRALASTTLNEHGKDYDVIEAALAHVDQNQVRRAYNRAEYITQRRELMQYWSDHIDQNSKFDGAITNIIGAY
ncbi:tyrosine-type recombinase/integrase [Thalassotalea maritima]|uniref:tyrosine-type recombinase/integrase n=1 Tax=Thalassotalea maritima TaxID=3242416 RepID=UPI0035287A48